MYCLKFWITGLVIALTLAAEGLELLESGKLIPEKWAPFCLFLTAFIPKVLAVIAHYSVPPNQQDRNSNFKCNDYTSEETHNDTR